jgi:hypothetical protein
MESVHGQNAGRSAAKGNNQMMYQGFATGDSRKKTPNIQSNLGNAAVGLIRLWRAK